MYLLYTTILVLVCFLGILVTFWFNWQSRFYFFLSREMSSPFECGFDPKDSARFPFSIRFFFMLVLFIMFDVELALVLHMPFMADSLVWFSHFGLLFFFCMLFVGLLEEWRRGMLSWKN